MSRLLKTLAVICLVAGSVWASGPDKVVLEFVRATRVQRGRAGYQVDVTISAALPSLGKRGVLRALKRQAPHGHAAYQVVLYDGDGLVKNNVIARYLSSELDAHRPEEILATEISPLNYRFTPKGRATVAGREALVYEVKPLHRRTGLFRGTVWLDCETSLPLKEQGKLEKLPSVWLKEITFTREYDLVRGFALPARISSEVKTRLVGNALIQIDFSNYRVEDTPRVEAVSADESNNSSNLLEFPHR